MTLIDLRAVASRLEAIFSTDPDYVTGADHWAPSNHALAAARRVLADARRATSRLPFEGHAVDVNVPLDELERTGRTGGNAVAWLTDVTFENAVRLQLHRSPVRRLRGWHKFSRSVLKKPVREFRAGTDTTPAA